MRLLAQRVAGIGWLLGPLAVGCSTVLVVAHASGRPASPAGVTLFICGVVAAYALDHWRDQPATQRASWVPALAGLATAGGLLAAAVLPMSLVALAVALGAIGLLYRVVKKIPLVKILVVAGSWTIAGLAFSVRWRAADVFPFSLAFTLGAVFAADVLLCDFKDDLADARSGVRTVVVVWGRRAAAAIAALLALAGLVAALAADRRGLAGAALALAVLAAFPRVLSRPVLGPALVDGALALPALMILARLA